MRYMLLIYADPAQPDTPEIIAQYNAFTEEATSRRALCASDQLHRANTATTVRVRNGRTLTSDGPFAETKEQIGGYYILDCEDLDEAIEYASKIPNAADGCFVGVDHQHVLHGAPFLSEAVVSLTILTTGRPGWPA